MASVRMDAEARMSLLAHLAEFQQRFVKMMIALLAGAVVGFFAATPVMTFLQAPYGQRFQVLGPTGGVVAYFRVALTIGTALALPVILYQVLMFVLPGLTAKERRFVLFSIPAISLLFLAGTAFAWFILMPPALGFLEGFAPTLFDPQWTADLYLNFVTALVFWIGVAFEMPLVFFVVSLLGAVSAGLLIHHWRIAVVVAAAAAAIITPTVDPINMLLVMGPLLVLYMVSIVLVMIGQRYASQRSA